MNVLNRLNQVIQTICPLKDGSIYIGTIGNSSSVSFIPAIGATQAQINAAQIAINSFDWSDTAQQAWENLQNRTAAQNLLTDSNGQGKILRAILMVTLNEINTLRATAAPPLPPRTLAQLKAAVINTLTAGNVDT